MNLGVGLGGRRGPLYRLHVELPVAGTRQFTRAGGLHPGALHPRKDCSEGRRRSLQSAGGAPSPGRGPTSDNRAGLIGHARARGISGPIVGDASFSLQPGKKAEADMRLAIKAWLKCPAEKRLSPAALG
jgi:hypothetical protein